MTMWKEFILYTLVVLIIIEVIYRAIDYMSYRLNNIPGDMEIVEEE